MNDGLTTVQTAQVVSGLHWATSRLFAVLGGWAGEADRPDVAVSLATTSRHLGWHATDLAELLPDSVLLADPAHTVDTAESLPPSPTVDAVVAEIAAIPGSVERLAIAHRVLLARLAARCVAVERAAAAHSDAALTRVLAFLLEDLRRDRDDGEALLGRLLTDVSFVEQVNARVLEAESRLVAVGGLLPARVED